MKIVISNPGNDKPPYYWMKSANNLIGACQCRNCNMLWLHDSKEWDEVVRMAGGKGFAFAFQYLDLCKCCDNPDWCPVAFETEIE